MTDVGMTGPVPSILGLEPAAVIAKFVTGMPQKFETSKNPVRLCGLLADIDDATGKTVLIERVAF
jgi:calcineurin-like phosphoesterase